MAYDEQLIDAVWQQARALPDTDATVWRCDQCGAWMHRDHLDSSESEFGWKILRVAPGSGNDAADLAAFHRDNDFDIGNGEPHCRVTADPSATQTSPGRERIEPSNTSV